MPTRSSEAIVIGGGPNGLACAFRLARAGRRVTLLDAGPVLGGGMTTVEFAPGYRVSGLAHLMPYPDPRLAAAMALDRHGLRYLARDLATTVLAPEGNLTVRGRQADGPDAALWAALHDRLAGHATALAPLRLMAPPRLARGAGNPTFTLLRRALGLRARGAASLRDLMRLLLTNLADVAEDELTDPRLQGLMAFDGTLGAWLGPRSPNSLILYLNRLAMGGLALPAGGMGAVAAAMQAAAEAAGVTCRAGARVARIETADHRATGVTLDDGTTLAADLVVSAIAPQTTFRQLLGPRDLDTGFWRRAGQIRARGAAAKLHLALTALPDFNADPAIRLVLAPSVDAVERAWNPVKYGEVPRHPVLEAILPSVLDPDLAPKGHHVLSAIVQFAPHAPQDRDAARAGLLDTTLQALEARAPGLRRLIAHAELLMPYDIEARHHLPGGCWHQADLAVEQMAMLRPLPEIAQYATPILGLWLAGAGMHPGGGVTGSPGWTAAGRILEETR